MGLRNWSKMDAWLSEVDSVLAEHERLTSEAERLIPTPAPASPPRFSTRRPPSDSARPSV